MFSAQWGVKQSEFISHLEEFYNHPFQRDRCFRVVAKEGKKIIGFQGLCYWPYSLNGTVFNSFQAMDSLVHQEFRRRGIFQKLLEHTDACTDRSGIDFLIGFPTSTSINSYLRNRWEHILDLRWYVKVLHPFWFLSGIDREKLISAFSPGPSPTSLELSSLRLANSPEFMSWRESYSSKNIYLSHSYRRGSLAASFTLKVSKRKRFISELIIGDFHCDSNEVSFINEAFRDLIEAVRRLKFITVLTIAINESGLPSLAKPLAGLGFTKINKTINFIVKNLDKDLHINAPGLWTLYGADMDTW